MTEGLSFNPRVVALDRAQPSSNTAAPPDFIPYFRRHVDAQRIAGGRAAYAQNLRWIPAIERQYGVPAAVVLAIWGSETNYGRDTGDFDLARAIASLAYEGRRRDLFAREFVALLKVADTGVPRTRLVGSWAGAFGNPQFLPSAYLRLARDGDGDGRIDLWSDSADTLASIANFLRDAGWRPGLPWGVRAIVAPGLDRAAIVNLATHGDCPRVHARASRWLSVGEWRRRGVEAETYLPAEAQAALIEPDGPGGPAFLLTTNYEAILQYNCSNYYALSVGLLADAIAR